MISWTEEVTHSLQAVRHQHPLVHNITNYVVMNSTANLLLSVGASPVMAHAVEEVEEMAGIAGALVLNIGTLSAPWIVAMRKAGAVAKRRGIPIVLDPVGAGATIYRTETASLLTREVQPSIIRGNASEILALAGGTSGTQGVDSRHPVEAARGAAAALAKSAGAVVSVTGPEDFITDGRREARVQNGHPLMARITGTGCAATAITGAFAAVTPDPFVAATAALVVFGIAGELAAEGNPRPGTFAVRLADALDEVAAEHIRRAARVG